MALRAWSLVGFLTESDAYNYFRYACRLPSTAPSILRQEYKVARQRLGTGSVPWHGQPNIQDIPPGYEMHLEGVRSSPRFGSTVNRRAAWSFKLVEIEPLIAFQLHVLADRVEGVAASVSSPPTVDEMLTICLPHQLEAIPFEFELPQPGSVVFTVRSESLNLRPHDPAMISEPTMQLMVAGATFGASSPLVQVASVGGRFYLHNGFHRACGLRLAGATHLPCVLFEARTLDEAVPAGRGFPAKVLGSANPPTVGHFTHGLAHEVQVCKLKKLIQISYSIRESEIPDD